MTDGWGQHQIIALDLVADYWYDTSLAAMLPYRRGGISRKSILLLQYFDSQRMWPVAPGSAKSAEPLHMLYCAHLLQASHSNEIPPCY